MGKTLKKFKYKDIEYEIKLMKRIDGTWFLKDFKDGLPFSFYCYSIREDVDVHKLEQLLNTPVIDYLINMAEDGVRFWVDNADKLQKYFR